MRRILGALLTALPLAAASGEFQQSLVISTGVLHEGELIVRNVTDLNSRKSCMAFYVRTTGTSPVLTCYDVLGEFGARIAQVGQVKEGKLVVSKIQDFTNAVACFVAYVGTEGTSPAIHCFPGKASAGSSLVQDGHLREGDLDVTRVVDPEGGRSCLVSYVDTPRTAPSLVCYESKPGRPSGLQQVSYLREGDLVVRKVVDAAGGKVCMVAYVRTEGTSSNLFCYDE